MTATTKTPTTLPLNYTKRRGIGHLTATAMHTLHPAELGIVYNAWCDFEGGNEDEPFNVLFEFVTPITGTRVWVCDRDGPQSRPVLMLPSDY